MTRPCSFKRLTLISVITVVFLAAAGPWVLYWIALSGVVGAPQLPATSASLHERQEIWKSMRGSGEPVVSATTPYDYVLLGFDFSRNPNKRAGILLAWQVASNYNTKHLKHGGTGWWHFSGAALTIWLTRNWTTDQLLSRAAEIRRQHVS